ncbi:serine protease persephone-like [Bactrocera tryoni]|uniref:serine protease persephone-like n=1 Tax=Bactrocera tryoni TaxID=59916 RepID=UPI001A96485B|nr:serine protease persephone-like [Bactrocera tryoni]XP_039964948.1 serine protease persephone-like [Bactrocera tryoni]XP_039964958.1 serine protease persephone-like [Bactrocera tryoni]
MMNLGFSLTFLLVLLFAKEICPNETTEQFIIYMDVHNDIDNLIHWGNNCEAKLTTLEQTVVETIQSRERSNEKYLETLNKLEYLEHTVSSYELKMNTLEHNIQSLISGSKQIEEELRNTIHMLSATVSDLASKFSLLHRDRPLPERERPFKTPSTTFGERRPTLVPPVTYVPPPKVPTAGRLVSQVCEEIEGALQSKGIKRFVSGIHPSLAIVERKLRRSSSFRCTGALIGQRFVLTSARCLYAGGANFVRLANRSDKTSALGKNIKKTYIHPKYANRKNNVGVIELEGDVEYSSLVYPSCLYTAATISIANAEVFYTQYQDSILSQTLQELRGQIVPYSNCATFAESHAQDPYEDSLICVRYYNALDSSYSSSQGPLFFNQKDVLGKERIIAVDSENSLRNDVYMAQKLTKVYDHLDFIESVMRS